MKTHKRNGNALVMTGGLVRQSTQESGFTLVEVLVASTVMELIICSVSISMCSSTQGMSASSDLTTAIMLAQQVRETTAGLSFSDPDALDQGKPPGADGDSPDFNLDDIDDLMGHTYGGENQNSAYPRSARPLYTGSNRLGIPMSEYPTWAQTIEITYRNPSHISEITYPRDNNAYVTDLMMVQVTITKAGQAIYTTQWLVHRGEAER